jgi:AcrR family transcriptional regulator
MRVTAKTKTRTRRRILDAACKLFGKRGFADTTTRDIAQAARIAAGTVFNYFPSKEALAMSLISDALEVAETDFLEKHRGDEAIEEALFLYILCGLRRLEPYRSFVGPTFETALSPFARAKHCEDAQRLRIRHLEQTNEILADRGIPELSFVAAHMYWTLYLGVVGFWTRDASPGQEDTLVVLDESIRLFAASLAAAPNPTEVLA